MVLDLNNSVSGDEAFGFLTARAAQRRGRRGMQDPTAFLMDGELVVQAAAGESILRLPWFDDGLFVGRQLPDISEMPHNVRCPAVAHYQAALAGERGRFTFVSYGHAYFVDAVPVHAEDGLIAAVLGIATPARGLPAAAAAYERTAERLERSAAQAEQRAERDRSAGRPLREVAERERARRASEAAARARVHACRLRGEGATPEILAITVRETDVLTLASHGLTSGEIAEELVVSVGTVRTHLENVYLKLGVSDKAAAVATAPPSPRRCRRHGAAVRAHRLGPARAIQLARDVARGVVHAAEPASDLRRPGEARVRHRDRRGERSSGQRLFEVTHDAHRRAGKRGHAVPTGDREEQITEMGSGGLANLAEYEAVRRGQRSDAIMDARLGGAWHDEKDLAGQILEPSRLSEGDAMCE